MRSVFADSFYSFALVNPTDPAHDRAVQFVGAYQGMIVTTQWILTEGGRWVGAAGATPEPVHRTVRRADR